MSQRSSRPQNSGLRDKAPAGPAQTVCKTVRQYGSSTISAEDMQKLLAVAADYRRVKNYVYARYGGIGSLPKLYPGYTVQNEMTASGLREQLELPSVYFYLAIFDALGDIKTQWTKVKMEIAGRVNRNTGFSEEEKHCLRFMLKVSPVFTAVANRKPVQLPEKLQEQYDRVVSRTDIKRLENYLRRQARKCLRKLHTDAADGFSIAERAYRYADHGIYISTKEKRKRVFVPLTDNNQYASQLWVKLYPLESRLELRVPVDVAVRRYREYVNQVGIALGFYTMLTTDGGNTYGEKLGDYQLEYSEWIRGQTAVYDRNRKHNPGRKKYQAKKHRLSESLHGYINQELNRFLDAEKPDTIYMAKPPKPQRAGSNKKINHSLALWQRGYIRKRLVQKCRERSVTIVETAGKDIGRICSRCGAAGEKKNGTFRCGSCGYEAGEKVNAARNVKQRGQKNEGNENP